MIFDICVIGKCEICRVGIDLPTIEVRYENLNIEADAYVGSRGLPTFINFMTNYLEVLKKIRFFIIIH